MQDAGISKQIVDTAYQNKVEKVYPTVSISAKRVTDLRLKKHNAIFPMQLVVRVVGIEEQEIGGGEKETFYNLEIREGSVLEKKAGDMSPSELREAIEQQVDEDI